MKNSSFDKEYPIFPLGDPLFKVYKIVDESNPMAPLTYLTYRRQGTRKSNICNAVKSFGRSYSKGEVLTVVNVMLQK